jgi:hypothetical protein
MRPRHGEATTLNVGGTALLLPLGARDRGDDRHTPRRHDAPAYMCVELDGLEIARWLVAQGAEGLNAIPEWDRRGSPA